MLRGLGYYVQRSPGSRSPIDLLAWNKNDPRPLWIQAKLGGRISKVDAAIVVDLAKSFGGVALLVFKRTGQKFTFRNLETGEEFIPEPYSY